MSCGILLLFKELVGIFIAFIFSWYYIPLFSELLKKKGFVGKDPLKPFKKEKTPEFVGIVCVLSIFATLGIYLILFPYRTTYILLAGFVCLIAGFMGLLDDLFVMRYRDHIVAMAVCAIFVVALLNYKGLLNMDIYIPFVGWVNFSFLYVAAIFLGFIFLPNAVNIYALTDGLSIGNALLLIGFFIIYTVIISGACNFGIVLFLITYFAYLPLLYYNKFPSKVFPGDVATQSLGALMMLSLMIAKIEFVACLAMIPYFLQTFLYVRRESKGIKDSRMPPVDEKGYLHLPEKDKYKVMYLLLKKRPMREPELTRALILIQALICLGVLGILVISKLVFHV